MSYRLLKWVEAQLVEGELELVSELELELKLARVVAVVVSAAVVVVVAVAAAVDPVIGQVVEARRHQNRNHNKG